MNNKALKVAPDNVDIEKNIKQFPNALEELEMLELPDDNDANLSTKPSSAFDYNDSWVDKFFKKVEAIDWKEVDNNINIVIIGTAKIVAYLGKTMASILSSAIFLYFLACLVPELREQLPSLYWLVDLVIKYGELFIHKGLQLMHLR